MIRGSSTNPLARPAAYEAAPQTAAAAPQRAASETARQLRAGCGWTDPHVQALLDTLSGTVQAQNGPDRRWHDKDAGAPRMVSGAGWGQAMFGTADRYSAKADDLAACLPH